MFSDQVLTLADVDRGPVTTLFTRLGVHLVEVPAGAAIPGSFWGEPEAGVVGSRLYARADTPMHSLLHELAHVVCMPDARRRQLVCDAGGDDLEETAVCYLQIVLAEQLTGVGREQLLRDMDTWGYSFRLGSAARWFGEDAEDAHAWLRTHGILAADGQPTFELRA